ncbi:hypothetical protein FACS1894201_07810 [Bacteroidia bacterium]|nr:hypothetical protein FACS1894201_07810 [Bacteroidia bacterium]
MKKIAILSVCVAFSVVCFSQNKEKLTREQRKEQRIEKKVKREESDPQASKILQKVKDQLVSYKSMKIDFTYAMANGKENVQNKKKGQILVQNNKFNMHFLEQNIISDGINIWTYSQSHKEVQISKVDIGSTNIINPMLIIDAYEKDFQAKYIRNGVEKGVKVELIDLIPFANHNFDKIRMIIAKDKNMLHSAEVYDKNGSVFTYTLDAIQPNVRCSDQDFVFSISKHPDVEVIDLR